MEKEKRTCHRCGKTLKKKKSGILIPKESHIPGEPYDGGWRNLYIMYCPCWSDAVKEIKDSGKQR